MDIATFNATMKRDGWIVFPSVLPADLVERMNRDLAAAYEYCRAIQVKNGIGENNEGSVHHLVGQGESFMEFLERLPLFEYITAYFEGNKFILNSLGGILNFPSNANYANRVHRDLRSFSGDMPMMLNMLVMLDDFTEANGATYMGTGSHTRADKPTDEEFYAIAGRATGKAGSIMLFNSNLWHAAGQNTTQGQRRCVTPTFTKPFVKQMCDYPRVVGYDKADTLSEHMLQLLGYNARVPANLDEWYQPPEKRMYKPGQG